MDATESQLTQAILAALKETEESDSVTTEELRQALLATGYRVSLQRLRKLIGRLEQAGQAVHDRRYVLQIDGISRPIATYKIACQVRKSVVQ